MYNSINLKYALDKCEPYFWLIKLEQKAIIMNQVYNDYRNKPGR